MCTSIMASKSTDNRSATHDIEIEKILIQQAQWIVERYESTNEGLMTRSASLAGFAGIELSLVGQMVVTLSYSTSIVHWNHRFTDLIFALIFLTVASLSISIISFLLALSATRTAKFPDHDSLIEILDYLDVNETDKHEADKLKYRKPIEQILMRHMPNESYPNYLKAENKTRGFKFILGLWSLVTAQLILVALIILIFGS